MTAGSDLVFDHLSHNHIEPRAEYQFVLFFFGGIILYNVITLYTVIILYELTV